MSSAYTYKNISLHLRYEPETGHLFWEKGGRGRKNLNIPTGTLRKKNGYMQTGFMGKMFLNHRLAWLLHNGVWPKAQIDHVNGDRKDNRIVNLREATSSDNNHNRTTGGRGTSGIPGVRFSSWHKKWWARIHSDSRFIHLGFFKDKEEAVSARREAELHYWGRFAPSNTNKII